MHFSAAIYVTTSTMADGIGKNLVNAFDNLAFGSFCTVRKSFFLNKLRIYVPFKLLSVRYTKPLILYIVLPIFISCIKIKSAKEFVSGKSPPNTSGLWRI